MSERRYDVFLCYNQSDQAIVTEVAEILADHGYKTWPNKSAVNRRAFSPKRLKDSKTIAVFWGIHGKVNPGEAWLPHVLEAQCRDGHPLVTILLAQAQPEHAPPILNLHPMVDLSQCMIRGGTETLAQEITDALRSKTRSLETPPPSAIGERAGLPPDYVTRSAHLDLLRNALLLTPNSPKKTSPPRTIAISGPMGSGKTVLAQALSNLPEVQATFPDGILWANFHNGNDETIRMIITKWQAILGNASRHATAEKLAQNLSDKRCLLVADHVENTETLTFLKIKAPGCRLLVTTRDPQTVHAFEPEILTLDGMSRAEALTILERRAPETMRQTEQTTKVEIAARLAYLPMALALAGSQLRLVGTRQWCKTFDALQNKNQPHATVFNTAYQLGLNLLDERTKRLYNALTVFKDEVIPFEAVYRLWSGLAGLNRKQSKKTILDLETRALLSCPPKSFAIHVPTQIKLSALAEQDPNSLRGNHSILLNAYRTTMKNNGGWHTALDDGYLYDHLLYHLDQATPRDERAPEIDQLFQGQDWFYARVKQGEYLREGYRRDLQTASTRAVDHAKGRLNQGREPGNFPQLFRLPLIQALQKEISPYRRPILAAHALTQKLLDGKQALSLILTLTEPTHICKMAAAMLETEVLDTRSRELLLKIALDEIHNIKDEETRAQTLLNLARHPKGTTLDLFVNESMAIKTEKYKASTLAALAPRLTENWISRCYESAMDMTFENNQALLLAALAPQLQTNKALQVFERARGMVEDINKARVMAALTQVFKDEHFVACLRQILTIHNPNRRRRTIAALIPGENREEKAAKLTRLLLEESLDTWLLTRTLVVVVPEWKEKVETLSLKAALNISDLQTREKALHILAPQLSDEGVIRGFSIVMAIQDETKRAGALATFSPRIPDELLPQAFEAAVEIADEAVRVQTLIALSPNFSGDLFRRCCSIILALNQEAAKATAMAALGQRLNSQDFPRFWKAVQMFKDDTIRMQTLNALVPHLHKHPLSARLESILAIRDEGNRAQALASLAIELKEDHLQKAIAAIKQMKSPANKCQALGAISRYVKDPDGTAIQLEALMAAETISSERVRADLFFPIIPHVKQALKKQLFEAVRKVKSESLYARLMEAFIPRGDGDILPLIWSACLDIKKEDTRVRLICQLAMRFEGKLAQCDTEAVLEIEDERLKARLLEALLPSLSGERLYEAWKTATTLEDIRLREHLVIAMSARLRLEPSSERLMEKDIEAALAIEDEGVRSGILESFIPRLSPSLIHKVLSATLSIASESHRASLLVKLAPFLNEKLLANAWQASQAVTNETLRGAIMKAMMPRLPETLHLQALESIYELESEHLRAEILVALIPTLDTAHQKQALNELYRLQNEFFCIESLIALIPNLNKIHLREFLEKALGLKNEFFRSKMFIHLAARLSGEAINLMFASACSIQNEGYRAGALEALGPKLKQTKLDEFLDQLPQIKDEFRMMRVLETVLLRLKKPKQLRRILELLPSLKEELHQARLMAMIAPRLSGKPLDKALDHTRTLRDPQTFIQASTALLRHLDQEQFTQWFHSVLDHRHDDSRVTSLLGLATDLSPGLQERAFDLAINAKEESLRVRLVMILLPKLTRDQLALAREVAQKTQDPRHRDRLLLALASRLSGNHPANRRPGQMMDSPIIQSTVIPAIQTPSKKTDKENVLTPPRTPVNPGRNDHPTHPPQKTTHTEIPSEAPSAVEVAVSKAEPATTEKEGTLSLEPLGNLLRQRTAANQEKALATLLPRLTSPEQLREAVQIIQKVDIEQLQLNTLLTLMEPPFTNHKKSLIEAMLNARAEMLGPDYEAHPLDPMNAASFDTLLERLFNLASISEGSAQRAKILRSLAHHATSELAMKICQVASELPSQMQAAEIMAILIPHLKEKEIAACMRIASHFKEMDAWVTVLAAAFPDQPEAEREPLLDLAWGAAESIETEWFRARAIAKLAPFLNVRHKDTAIHDIFRMEHLEALVFSLSALAPELDNDLKQAALTKAAAIHNEQLRAEALSILIPYLESAQLKEALKALPKFTWPKYQTRIRAAFAPRLGENAVNQALSTLSEVEEERARAAILFDLAHQLNPSNERLYLDQVESLQNEDLLAETLQKAAAYLSEKAIFRSVKTVASMQSQALQFDTLTVLLTQSGRQDQLLTQARCFLLDLLKKEPSPSVGDLVGLLGHELFTMLFPTALIAEHFAREFINLTETWDWT